MNEYMAVKRIVQRSVNRIFRSVFPSDWSRKQGRRAKRIKAWDDNSNSYFLFSCAFRGVCQHSTASMAQGRSGNQRTGIRIFSCICLFSSVCSDEFHLQLNAAEQRKHADAQHSECIDVSAGCGVQLDFYPAFRSYRSCAGNSNGRSDHCMYYDMGSFCKITGISMPKRRKTPL